MDIRKLQRVIIDALEDVKAQDIRVYNTTEQTELFDRVIIASGTSNRQTRALAANVRDCVKQAGGDVISVEGDDTGEWVLVDLGDAVVHIMQPAIRDYYRLEELWGSKPVRVKTAEAARKPVSTKPSAAKSEPATNEAPAKKPAAKKPAAKKAAVAKTVASKASTRKPADGKPAAKKPAAKKPAARKPASRKPAG
jgi:ribosome-associated protein